MCLQSSACLIMCTSMYQGCVCHCVAAPLLLLPSYSGIQRPSSSCKQAVAPLSMSICYCIYHSFFFLVVHFCFPASGQAVVTGVVPSRPRFLPSIFIAHRVQQSHCSSIFHRVLLTHALAFSASQFVHKEKSPRIHTSMYSEGFELTKLTYTRLEDNLIRHRGDRRR